MDWSAVMKYLNKSVKQNSLKKLVVIIYISFPLAPVNITLPA